MTTSPRTVRLHNTCQMDLSLQLQRDSSRFNPRLRRGMHITNIKIGRGRVFDMCKELDISFEEARRIAAHSPQVQARQRSRHLLVRDHPPSEENLAAEAVETAKYEKAVALTAALNPPDPVGSLPAGVDPRAVGLPVSTPRRVHPPISAATLLDVAPVASLETVPEDSDEDDSDEEETSDEPQLIEVDVPSMEWSLRRLKRYANENDIDLDGARSKTAILKKIKDTGDGNA